MADGIKDKVAIIGMGCIRFGERWDKSEDDLVVDAVKLALEDSGVEHKDVEAAWFGTQFSGMTGLKLNMPAKFQYIPCTRFVYIVDILRLGYLRRFYRQ